MEHSPSWEANRFPASQEISSILWNPKIHNRVHKSPPPAPVLSHINSFHALYPISLKIHFNISFHLCLGLPVGVFPSCFPHQKLSSSWYLLHAPHIAFFLICSLENVWGFQLTKHLQSTRHNNYLCHRSHDPLSPFRIWKVLSTVLAERRICPYI